MSNSREYSGSVQKIIQRISYETQIEFEIGYDESTNRITIPIRDEISSLVGVKGRLLKEEISKPVRNGNKDLSAK